MSKLIDSMLLHKVYDDEISHKDQNNIKANPEKPPSDFSEMDLG